MHARVHAGGDESLDLHALPGQGVLVVPITVIRGDASSVPKEVGGLILHGVSDSREDVAPGKFTVSQGVVQLSQMKPSRVGWERPDESSEGSINSRVVFCHDGLVRDAKGVAEVVDHGGHQGAVHDATGDESRERDAQRRAEAQCRRRPWWLATRSGPASPPIERSADRGPQLPVKSDQQVLVQHVPVDAHVVRELGDISVLPGEDHLGGERDQRCQSQSASSQARTVSHARALMCSREPKADPSAVGRGRQQCDARSACPSPGTRAGGREGKQAHEPLDVAVGNTPPGGTKGSKGSVQDTKEGIKLKGTDEHLPVIDEPLFADALVLSGIGEELPKARNARLPQHQRTLESAKHVTLLSSPVGGESSSRGEGGDGVGLVLPLSPGCGFREVCVEGCADARPLGVAKHVDQVQVGRDKRLKRAIDRQKFSGAAPVAEASQAPGKLLPH